MPSSKAVVITFGVQEIEMIPKNIAKRHILQAIGDIDKNGVPSGRDSTTYSLLFNVKSYPPKYIVSLANKFANGSELNPSVFSGGVETNNYLKALGFQILGSQSESPKQARKAKSSLKSKVHDQRCKECKKHLIEMFRRVYGNGNVKVNHKIDILTRLQEYAQKPYYQQLTEIFKALEAYKGNSNFVRSNILPRCDLFVVSPGFDVEFDESQHFTAPRKVSLSCYPKNLRPGYDRARWMALCEQIDAKDNDPPNRDETRAWYDTLRDFLPIIDSSLLPTVRIKMGDFSWCSLDPSRPEDVKRFTDLTNLPLPKGFRVGRTILDIGESMSSLKKGSNMWHEHRRAISSYFIANPSRYQERIHNLIEKAKANNIDVLLLPACALLYRNSKELKAYRSEATDIPWLATGMLKIIEHAKPKDYFETAETWKTGQSIVQFDNSHVEWLQMNSVSAYVAISSTIKNICSNKKVTSSKHYPPRRGVSTFGFDLGHHQYNGRYKKVLNRVLKAIDNQNELKSAVILSFWKYLNGSTNSPWAVPDSDFKRIEVPTPDRLLTDYLDVFEFAKRV